MPKKPGKGGAGPENYDPATGQYIDTEKEEGTEVENGAVSGGQGQESVAEEDDFSDIEFLSDTALEDFMSELEDLNQMSSIPPLNSLQEVEDNIEQFFSKRVVDQLDRLVNRSANCQPFQFHPKANPWVNLNIYTCVFGKYRYQDNHATYISQSEYLKMARDTANFAKVYRGITSQGARRQSILDSYATMDIDNLDIYGNGMYGTNVYTTLSIQYARSYGTPIMGLVDKNARSIESDDLHAIRSGFDFTNMEKRVVTHLQGMGLTPERSGEIAHYFVSAVKNDISLVAILLGYDYQYGDGSYNGYPNHQRNILNLKKWYIVKEY